MVFNLNAQIHYPETKKGSQTDNYHGQVVADPYRWLEDDNSDSTKQWVLQQNKVTDTYLNTIPFREQIKKRLSDVYNYTRYSVPQVNNGYYYYHKNNGLQNQSVLYRQKGLDGKPELVLDPNTFSTDGTTQLSNFTVSKNGKYATVGKSTGGSDWSTYSIMDLDTKTYLPDSIAWVKFSYPCWKNNGFYYSRYPEPKAGNELSSKNEDHQIWYHKVGTGQSEDQLIYQDTANLQRFHVTFLNEDERFLFINVTDRGKGFDGNALLFSDLDAKDKTFRPIVQEVGKFIYEIINVTETNRFLIRTNENAPNSKIVLVDPAAPQKENWKTIIAETKYPVEGVTYAAGKLFIRYLKDVTSKVQVYTDSGKQTGEVDLPGPGSTDGFEGNIKDQFVFYSYTSFNFPMSIFTYEVSTGKSYLFKKPEIDFNPGNYVTKQEFYTSRDGTRIPVFIVHKKGLKKDGTNPALLYGYGGFNVTLGPGFSAGLISWLEQDGIYAVANLRGGGEYGEKWHEAGMFGNKQNVFDDFIAAAEYLIAKKYTSPELLAIRGGSNGGTLVGAVINQRPDLFRVAIPEVGVMDMLRFHSFTIGWNWKAEYGSSENKKEFTYLYAYSPLHNIKTGINYPATLVITGDHDDRVVPAHSFKYIATLQDRYKGRNPVLVRIETNSGHGSSNMMKYIDLNADLYAFILYNMGLGWKQENKTDNKK